MVGFETCWGLEYVYVWGLVYWDIKFVNLFFGDDGWLRIADFGLVCVIVEVVWIELVGVVLGTVCYVLFE